MDVSLEITGSGDGDGSSHNHNHNHNHNHKQPYSLSMKRVSKSCNFTRLIVPRAPTLWNKETVDECLALWMKEWDRNKRSPLRLVKVLLSEIQFTADGVQAWSEFLNHITATNHSGGSTTALRHVALHGMLNLKQTAKYNEKKDTKDDDDDNNDELLLQNFVSLCQAFASSLSPSSLTVLDLSRNTLYGSDIWSPWTTTAKTATHGNAENNNNNNGIITLKQFILDSVELDEASWCSLEQGNFSNKRNSPNWGETLEDLHIVLETGPPPTDAALQKFGYFGF